LHCSESWHTSRKNVKNNQNEALKNMNKSTVQAEKMAAIEMLRIQKSLRMAKSWRR
jgi:hypothetical protein